jgi:hypothetical protein
MQFSIFIGGASQTIFGNSAVTTGTWYHVVVRRNSSDLMELIINDVVQTDTATKSGTINPTGTASYTLGADRTFSGSLN